MKIVFKKIVIKNFKGISELKLRFEESKNILEGENGVGKTSVLDAITWCLFGKNFADEKLFPIKPIIDGEVKGDLVTSVELTLNDIVIERIWSNSATTIKVDGVKFSVSELKEYLRDNFLITDEEFKALTNVDYIPNLHWKDLRSLIMSLVGELKNEEIYENTDVSLIKDKIESVGVEKTADDIRETKTHLNNELKILSGNIDQKTSDIQALVVDDKEVIELEKRKEILKSAIDKYNQLRNKKALQDEEIRKLEEMKQELSNNEVQQLKLSEQNIEYQKTYEHSNIDLTLLKENKKKEIENKISNKKNDMNRLELEKTSLIAEREELREKYTKEVNKEIRIENERCSVCGQILPKEKIQETLSKLKAESEQLANTYALKAKERLTRMNEIDMVVVSYQNEIIEAEKSIQDIDDLMIDPNEESEIQQLMKRNINSNNKRIQDLELEKDVLKNQIESYEQKIRVHEVITINDITFLQQELEEITKRLAVSDTIKTFEQQLQELENKHQDLIKQKEILNEKEQQLIAFNNTRAEMLKNRIKHNFKLTDFITQETTKDGKLIETFKIAIDGIEYNALNTGHKTLVALDLIDNIQRMKDKRLPILIDGLGELTRLPELDTQMIGCRAKFQTNKKLDVVH